MQALRHNEIPLAEGANGVVRLSPNQTHVYKRLKDYGDAAALLVFRAEIQLLASIKHTCAGPAGRHA